MITLRHCLWIMSTKVSNNKDAYSISRTHLSLLSINSDLVVWNDIHGEDWFLSLKDCKRLWGWPGGIGPNVQGLKCTICHQ